MKRRIFIGIIVVVVLLLGAGYAVGGAMVYGQLSSVQAKCQLRTQDGWPQNTPSAFSAGEEASLDMKPYEMAAYQDVTFPSRDDKVNVSAWYIPAQGANEAGSPTIILVHGLNDCKHSPFILLPAGMLNHAGFNVLLIDLRNHGDSQVTDGRYAAGTLEYLDVLGAWDWLVNEKGAKPEKIGLFGTSLGAATVLIATGKEPQIAATWEDSSYADINVAIRAELSRNGFPLFLAPAGVLMGRVISGRDIASYSPLQAMSQLNGRPVFITHGDADKRLSVQYASDLADAIRANGGQVEPWIVSGSEHIMAMFNHTDEYQQKLIAFFSDSLGK